MEKFRFEYKDYSKLSVNFNCISEMNKFIRVTSGQCSAKQMLSSRTHNRLATSRPLISSQGTEKNREKRASKRSRSDRPRA